MHIFTNRYTLIGPLIWMSVVIFFIAQPIVARAWPVPYSLGHNTISDLGNTSCGLMPAGYVCSPLHNLMDISLIVVGVIMTVGSIFIYQEFRGNRLSILGFFFMDLAGVGTVLVGAFPENVSAQMHNLGAALTLVLGNLSLIVLAITLDLPKTFRYYTIVSGLLPLLFLPPFYSHTYFGLGPGGMERVVTYPQSVWLIMFGIYMLHDHYRRQYYSVEADSSAKLR